MKSQVLLDTDVLLDILLDRTPYAQEAITLWNLIETKRIDAYVAQTTLDKIFRLAKKRNGPDIAQKAILEILPVIKVCPFNNNNLKKVASLKNIDDFEDALQLIAALSLRLDAIITRNRKSFYQTITQNYRNFAEAAIPILSAREFLVNLSLTNQLLSSITEKIETNSLLTYYNLPYENLEIEFSQTVDIYNGIQSTIASNFEKLNCRNIEDLLKQYSAGERNFSRVQLSGAILNNVTLYGVNLDWANFSQSELKLANLNGSNLCGTNFSRANLDSVDLRKSYLNSADLNGACLNRADLSQANLTGANLRRANLRYANLHKAILKGADLSFADLTGADLRETDLTGANLIGATLDQALLIEADLSEANLSKANLTRADLSEAVLCAADLSNSDLSNAILIRVDLSEADLSEADLLNADLSYT